MPLTNHQELAAESRGGARLVSAAAGSGKTKVLVERLMRYVDRGADIDQFLVITYTRAAAAELRSRILSALGERIAADPMNRRLRRQTELCCRASIGTIDSICGRFLRENTHLAGISPDYRVIEPDRSDEICARVLDKLLEELYETIEEDAGVRALVDSFGSGDNDDKLSTLVLRLYKSLQSHADPDAWLAEQRERLTDAWNDAGDTPWGQYLLSRTRSQAQYWAERIEELRLRLDEPDRDAKIKKAYTNNLDFAGDAARDMARAAALGWDKARLACPGPFPRRGIYKGDDPLAQRIIAVWTGFKDTAAKWQELFANDSDALLRDLAVNTPAVDALLALTQKLGAAFAAEKKRQGVCDFSDQEHLVLKLLTDSSNGLAAALSSRYTEVLVDEYQDVNACQDALFRLLSDNGRKLFMVGDVKQSIYRFRLADPLIFTDKYEKYAFLPDAREGEPVKIMLQENFRSRREVIDGINGVFEVCMSKKLGEVDYDENAQLKCGGVYEDEGVSPELVLIDISADEDDLRGKAEKEAAAVAEKIIELMHSGMTVNGRALGYGDIALLMRSANSVGETYRRELILRGIPVAAGQGGSFFGSTEIASLMSLLAVIDNPHQDVALIAVLRSGAFGFSADELTEIRLADRNSDFYTALKAAAQDNEKCANFLKTLDKLRSRAPEMSIDELLMFVYDELDLMALCAAMQDAPQRCANMRMMLTLAKRFSAGGFRGLHRFCRWLRQLAERGGDMGAASSDDAVKIMTIHKSKGLEFPVVFVCDTSRRFNDADLKQTVLVHPELGLGAKIYDTARRLEYPGLVRSAIKQRLRREQLSEEMRLLYVALTRARERLIVTAAIKHPEEKMQKMMLQCTRPMSPEILLNASSMAEWMIYAQLCAEDEKFRLSFLSTEAQEAGQDTAAVADITCADPELVAALEKNAAFSYPHAAASALPSKVTATELKRLEAPDEEAQSIVPMQHAHFRAPRLGGDKLSPTARGTATHMLLQYIDYEKTGTEQEIREELARLTAARFLSARQAEAVDTGSILRLFSSPLGKRIMSADARKREFKFSLLCPAEKFFPGGEGESVLMQGVIDCMIEEAGELTIIDYKTDRVRGEETAERAQTYSKQLEAYAYAAQRMTGKPVRECVLYFLYSGETVKSSCK